MEISDVYKKVRYFEKISEEHIETLKIKKYDEDQYKAILNDYLGILTDIAVYEDVFQKEDKNKVISKMHQIVYDANDFNWEKLYVAINILNKELFDKLINICNDCKELDELDFKICCLIISNFSQNEISILLRTPLRKIQRKITHIRITFGIEKGENIKAYIELQE